MKLPFDEREVRAAFDGATFQRGRHYALDGAVRGLKVSDDGRRLWAQVRGSGRQPYRVQVTVADGRGRRVVSYCSCPIGSQCKHGVAVMLSALRSSGSLQSAPPPPQCEPRQPSPAPPPPPTPLAGPVGDWLKQLAEALGDAP
ncbi:MAG: SWIM zinc finger domain-containing protein, partial [Geminicoccaceae bacterium]